MKQEETAREDDFKRPDLTVDIAAIGMLTPVGADAQMTAVSVRAGLSAYQASSIHNKALQPMTMALVPDEALPPLQDNLINQGLTLRQQRMLRLATQPLQQALGSGVNQPLPLMLCGPEKTPGTHSVVSDRFIQHLQIQAECRIDLENSYVFAHGRAGGFYALEAAMQMLQQGEHRQVVVGGVDTYFDLRLLASLDNEDRVLAEGVMDAFAPGEGAAFLVLQAADSQTKARIHPPGIAEEQGHRYSEQPYRGDGLAQALDEALEVDDSEPVCTVLSSFNGENFSAREWSVSALRNQQRLRADFNLEHPADCYGDLGAASAVVLIALAALGKREGYYPGPVLVWASSELQQRGAVLIT